MLDKYSRKNILIGAIVVALIIIILLPSIREKTTYDIPDRCGVFINLFSHTIETEKTCKIRCTQKCETSDLKYDSVDFTLATQGCHTCTCHCKEPLWR